MSVTLGKKNFWPIGFFTPIFWPQIFWPINFLTKNFLSLLYKTQLTVLKTTVMTMSKISLQCQFAHFSWNRNMTLSGKYQCQSTDIVATFSCQQCRIVEQKNVDNVMTLYVRGIGPWRNVNSSHRIQENEYINIYAENLGNNITNLLFKLQLYFFYGNLKGPPL
jgi:hypothetical protein